MSEQFGDEPELEANTLPVFYYNDYLLSEVGGEIVLNLFEPRYKHMCHLMVDRDPRFLFVPNFGMYQCKLGDVGFVVRVDSISDNGRTFSIRGHAEERVIIDFMWVEPDSQGLHFAHYWNIPAHISGLSWRETQSFCMQLLSSGWLMDENGIFAHPDAQISELLQNTNFQNSRIFVLRTNCREKATKLLQDAWELFTKNSHHKQSDLHRHVHIVDAFPEPTPLSEAVDAMSSLFQWERLPSTSPDCTSRAMSHLQICGFYCADCIMHCNLPTVKLELVRALPIQLRDSLPFLETCLNHSRDPEVGVCVSNHSNVVFYAPLKDCQVTAESTRNMLEIFRWQLNQTRLRVLWHARERGMGPLATLQDDPAQLVCDFIALRPSQSDALAST